MPKGTLKKDGSKPTPSKVKQADMKALCLQLYFQGYGFNEMIDRIKKEESRVVSEQTLKDWINEHLEILKATHSDVVAEHKFVELERINRLEVEYWNAWKLSIAPEVKMKEIFKAPAKVPGKRVRVSIKNPHGVLEQTIKETRTLTGDSKFLQGVQWCVEQRIKLLGFGATKKNEIGDGLEEQVSETGEALKDAILDGGQQRRVVFAVKGGQKFGNVGGQ